MACANGDVSDAAIDAASRRIDDVLVSDGMGGYLIPDEQLTWVLRDVRSLWSRANVKDCAGQRIAVGSGLVESGL